MSDRVLGLFASLLDTVSPASFAGDGWTIPLADLNEGLIRIEFGKAPAIKGKCHIVMGLAHAKSVERRRSRLSYPVLLIPARLDGDAKDDNQYQLFPWLTDYPVINEDYLDGRGTLSDDIELRLGYVQDYQAAVKNIRAPNTDDWRIWYAYVQQLFRDTCGFEIDELPEQWGKQFDRETFVLRSVLYAPPDNGADMALIELYNGLLTDGADEYAHTALQRLLDWYQGSPAVNHYFPDYWFPTIPPNLVPCINQPLLGHMDEQVSSEQDDLSARSLFPLDNTQRQAALCSANLPLNKPVVMAVNGPPGSGKTAMLKAVIAHTWVEAAIHRKPCPIMVAVGATNQSVTNVISAFDKVPHQAEGSRNLLLYQRWVTGVPSYGTFLPAKSFFSSEDPNDLVTRDKYVIARRSEGTRPCLFEWVDESASLSEPSFLTEMEQHFLHCAGQYFTLTLGECALLDTVDDAIELLRSLLNERCELMEQYRQTLKNAVKKGRPDDILTLVSDNQIPQATDVLQQLTQLMGSSREEVWCLVREVCRENLTDRAVSIATNGKQSDQYTVFAAHQELFIHEAATLLIERYLDIEYRSQLFHIAARYWEGQYIQQCGREILLAADRANVTMALRRLCMLTPCLVSTINSVPRQFSVRTTLPGEKERRFAYGVADLLIMDETGLAPVHKALPVFSLAKKAIAVGDVKQLRPVVSNVAPIREQLAVLYHGFSESDHAQWYKKGTLVSKGSMLHLVRHCSHFGYQGQGMPLRGHYRCQTEIIQLCNEMVYDHKLFFLPHMSKRLGPLPPMAWVASESASTREGWSRVNYPEAEQIARFIIEQWPHLHADYQQRGSLPKLQQVIAIVTPFNPQEAVLRQVLMDHLGRQRVTEEEAAWISESDIKAMAIGTVNKLQGAEWDIVLFSGVHTATDGGTPFFNEQPYLINVAVSRAQKSFIAFICPRLYGVYAADHITPNNALRGNSIKYLGYYLGKFGERLLPKKLVVIEAAGKLNSLAEYLGVNYEVVATGGCIHEVGLNAAALSSETGLRPRYQLTDKGRRAVLTVIEKARFTDEIILATDDDYVGEAIAWHVYQHCIKREPHLASKFSRVRLRAINRDAVEEAFKQPCEIDQNRVAAEITREICDILLARKLYQVATESTVSEQYLTEVVENAKRYRLIAPDSYDARFNQGIGRVKSGVLNMLYECLPRQILEQEFGVIEARLNIDGQTLTGTLVDPTHKLTRRVDTSQPLSCENWQCRLADEIEVVLPPPAGSTAELLKQGWQKHRLKPDEVMSALQLLYQGE